MIVQLFFLLPVSFSKEGKFIETKHMTGGVFGWHKALISQRNLWSKIPIPIKIYTTEINLPKLLEKPIGDVLPDFNLTDLFNNLFGNKDEEEDSKSKILSKSKLNGLINANLNPDLFSHRSFREGEESDYLGKCKNKNLKNIDLLGDIVASIGENLNLSCEELDELVGQVFSYSFLIIPITIMWVIVTIFYIFYCYGCCCCCRAKDRYNPGIVSIVFFVIIASFLIIALGFNIAASVYLYDILNYAFQGDAFKDIDYSLSYVSPALSSIAGDLQGNLTDSLDGITDSLNTSIDTTVADIKTYIVDAVNGLDELHQLFNEVDETNKTNVQNTVSAKEDFAKCYYVLNEEPNTKSDCAKRVDLINENIFSNINIEPINQLIESIKSIEESVNGVNDTLDDLDSISEVKEEIIKVFDEALSEVKDLDLQSEVNKLNVSEFTSYIEDYEDGLPYKKYHMAAYSTIFFFPMFMVILTSLEIMAFWLKNCCSKCIVCYCCPRCICSCCLFFIGLFCTMAAVGLIMIDIIYDQGDDLMDMVLKKLLNENKTLSLGKFDAGSMSNGMIPNLEFQDFQIPEPKLIKTFVNAKLGAKFTEFIAVFDFIPLDQVADVFNNSFSNVEANTSLITGPIDQAFKQMSQLIEENAGTFDDLPTTDVSNILNDERLQGASKEMERKCEIDPTGMQCVGNYDESIKQYEDLFKKLTDLQQKAGPTMRSTSKSIEGISSGIHPKITGLVTGLLSDIGGSFSNVINTIQPSIDGTNVDWMISAFNIIRVKCCRQLIGAAMAFSISAHLFLVGYAAMTILLCCRRKGMGKVPKDRAVPTFSYSEYSYSQDEPKKTKKKNKKKKGRHDSDDEDTSGNALVEFHDDDQPHSDAEKRGIDDDSERYSDDQSNYANPYQHDESSISYQINDESTIQQSESFQPRVSENENESSVQNNDFSFDDDESTTDNKANNIANIIKDIKDQQESESEPAKISETEDNDDDNDESSNYPNSNNINFHDDESSGNNSDIDDGDQQTYVF